MFTSITMTFLGLMLPSMTLGVTDLITEKTPAVITQEETYPVLLTGYNAVPEQTNEDPTTTASGVRSNPEVVAARSRDMAESLPYGTVIALEAPLSDPENSCGFSVVEHLIGYRVLADTMHIRKHDQIDIMLSTTDTVSVGDKDINPAIALGICNVTARVVGQIDLKDIPTTQTELVRMIDGSTLAMK